MQYTVRTLQTPFPVEKPVKLGESPTLNRKSSISIFNAIYERLNRILMLYNC